MMSLNDPYAHLILHRQRSQELITKSEQDRIWKLLRGRRASDSHLATAPGRRQATPGSSPRACCRIDVASKVMGPDLTRMPDRSGVEPRQSARSAEQAGWRSIALLACGTVAGPLFFAIFLTAGAVRPDYDQRGLQSGNGY